MLEYSRKANQEIFERNEKLLRDVIYKGIRRSVNYHYVPD